MGQKIQAEADFMHDTRAAVQAAMESSTSLGQRCLMEINQLRGSQAFQGPASLVAEQTMEEIYQDLQKIAHHGNALAEHLGKSADSMTANEDDAVNAIRSVLGG